jgi:uncharacterized protein (DUF302 family)
MKGITLFLTGLILGVAATIFIIVAILPKHMFIEHESKLGFNETVDAVANSAIENKWSMPHTYDLQATMKKHGHEVNPVTVFSLCKPELAYQILESKDVRSASALMPCRISVYEKDGKTYISMLNAGMLSKLMGKKAGKVMGAASAGNEEILKTIIQ